MRDDNVDAASRRVPTDVDAAPCRIPPDNHPNEMIPPVPDFPPTPTYFDPLEPIANLAGNLPHWRQDVCIYFVTFRLADSIPAERLHRWLAERDDWLARNPPPIPPHSAASITTVSPSGWNVGSTAATDRVSYGRRVKSVVENALRHFAGCRYASTSSSSCPITSMFSSRRGRPTSCRPFCIPGNPSRPRQSIGFAAAAALCGRRRVLITSSDRRSPSNAFANTSATIPFQENRRSGVPPLAKCGETPRLPSPEE